MTFKIQRFSHDFGASEDSDAVNFVSTYGLDAVGDTSLAFARITNTRFQSGGTAAGVTADRNVDDLGATCLLTATNTVTLTRQSSGTNEDVRCEVEIWEWTGSSGAADGFEVKAHENITVSSLTANSSSITWGTQAQGVPVICGVSCDNTAQNNDRAAPSVMITASGCTVEKGDSASTMTVSVALIEFGSNWNVQNNIEHRGFSSAGSVETETISAVTWANTLIFAGYSHQTTPCDEVGFICFPGSTTTTLSFWVENSHSDIADADIVAHIAEHASLAVDHDDTINGGETAIAGGSGQPVTNDFTVATQDALTTSAVIAYCDDDDTGANYPRGWLNYYLTSTSNLRFWKSRSGSTQNFSYQVIDFSSIGGGGGTDKTVTPSTLAATSSTQAPSVSSEENVTITPTELTGTTSVQAPSVDAEQNVTVSPAEQTATSSIEASSVSAEENVTITPSELSGIASVQAPSVSAEENVTITPTEQTATTSTQAPGVTAEQNVTATPGALDATSSVQTPSASTEGNATESAAVQEATSTVQSPSVTAEQNVTITPSEQSVTAQEQAPSITVDESVSPGTQDATATAQTPSVAIESNAIQAPSVLEGTASVQAPSVSIEQSATVQPDALSSTASLEAPSVSTEEVIPYPTGHVVEVKQKESTTTQQAREIVTQSASTQIGAKTVNCYNSESVTAVNL